MPYINPVLDALDRMQQRQAHRPQQLTDHAQYLMSARLGQAEEKAEAAFAHGGTGLLGGHTHYFDGFALLMPLQYGTAVAVRGVRRTVSRIVFEGSDTVWEFDRSDGQSREAPLWVCIVEQVVRHWAPPGLQVEVAVVSTVQAGCTDAYLAALGVATARAVEAAFALALDRPEVLHGVRRIIANCGSFPFSIAYPITAEAGRPDSFTLVDTATDEHLPVPAPPLEAIGWGLVDVGTGLLRDPAIYDKRKEQADEALALLQLGSFEDLTSIRDVEHVDLPEVLAALPPTLQPIVRHLVTENQRVSRVVFALQRRDWQMFGALLLMSYASLRNDWGTTTPEVDFIVKEVEGMTLEGMYGACATGRSGCVLIVGQPFIIPGCLDRLRASFEKRFGRRPEGVLL